MRSGPARGCRCPETSTVLLELAQEHLLVCGKSALTPSSKILAPCYWGPTLLCTTFTLLRNSFRTTPGSIGGGDGWWPQRGPSLCRVAPGETSGLPQPLPAVVQRLSFSLLSSTSTTPLPTFTDKTPIATDWMRTVHNIF